MQHLEAHAVPEPVPPRRHGSRWPSLGGRSGDSGATEVINVPPGKPRSTDAAPPAWSLSSWLTTSMSTSLAAVARRYGTTTRLPASASTL
jgi:hypothetical protein